MEEKKMVHSQNEKSCDFCRIGRIKKSSLRIALRQDTDLGRISCLADIPVGACDRCGWQIWSQDTEAITEDAIRREYVKLLSARRRSSNPYHDEPLYCRHLYTHIGAHLYTHMRAWRAANRLITDPNPPPPPASPQAPAGSCS